jgi:hypothetical protein
MTVLYLKNFTGKVEASGSISLTEEPSVKAITEHKELPSYKDYSSLLGDFVTQEFVRTTFEHKPALYIFSFLRKDNSLYPYYVGQTSQMDIRFNTNDYFAPGIYLTEPTGFKVKGVAKYLAEKGTKVMLSYRYLPNSTGKNNKQRLNLERSTRALLKNEGYILIDKIPEFNPKSGDEEQEYQKVKEFCNLYYIKEL